jgi:2-oxoglutarate dehydrogenase E1 component
MNEQSPNGQFHASSFLQGHNAQYVEQLYARYAADPNSVDPSWAAFFHALGDDPSAVTDEASGAPWARDDWPPSPNGEIVAALDGNWDAVPDPGKLAGKIKGKAGLKGVSDSDLRGAVLDSIRAIMYIRSFRSRGHLAADLDPLKLHGKVQHPEFDPRFFGFTDGDLDRPIAPMPAPSRCSSCT